MRLTVYYAVIALAFPWLASVDPDAAQVLLPFVVVMALAPAVYSEWLRVFRRGPSDDA